MVLLLQGQNSEYAKSNSAKVNKLDTMDRGAGYDENDSFIDNTEAVCLLIMKNEYGKNFFLINVKNPYESITLDLFSHSHFSMTS